MSIAKKQSRCDEPAITMVLSGECIIRRGPINGESLECICPHGRPSPGLRLQMARLWALRSLRSSRTRYRGKVVVTIHFWLISVFSGPQQSHHDLRVSTPPSLKSTLKWGSKRLLNRTKPNETGGSRSICRKFLPRGYLKNTYQKMPIYGCPQISSKLRRTQDLEKDEHWV
jgi:hypothetical protein